MSASFNKKSVMTHIILGYPSLEANRKLISTMSDAGVDHIEMQIPFTDPIADGPTILNANQKALDTKINLADCIKFAGEMTSSFKEINFLFMSYYNIIFNAGIENFIRKSKKNNLYGIIAPDIPFEEDKEGFFPTCKKYHMHPIYVFSPTTSENRLKKISRLVSGFVYCTSRIGITGAGKNPHQRLAEYIKKAKKIFNIPLAIGFGIDSAAKAKMTAQFADIVIIGSKIINIINESGKNFQKPVFDFLKGVIKEVRA